MASASHATETSSRWSSSTAHGCCPMSGTSRISKDATLSRSASPSAASQRVPTRRSQPRPCGYSRYHHNGCFRACSCGLHKQAARAQGRSSVAPPAVGAFVPQADALRRARALSTGGEHGRGSMRRLAPRSGRLPCSHPPQLRQPASGLPSHRSKPAALAFARFAVFPWAPQAPYRGLAP